MSPLFKKFTAGIMFFGFLFFIIHQVVVKEMDPSISLVIILAYIYAGLESFFLRHEIVNWFNRKGLK